MINDVFSQVEESIGKSLYKDDAALWIRGRNISFVKRKIQAPIAEVEEWVSKWGFKLSVAKTSYLFLKTAYNHTYFPKML